MELIDYGIFSHYAGPEVRIDNVIYLKNENGVDWYAICHAKDNPAGTWLIVRPDGEVVIARTDVSQMFPANMRVVLAVGASEAGVAGKDYRNGALVDRDTSPKTVTRRQIAKEMLLRRAMTAEEAAAFCATGALPAFMSERIPSTLSDSARMDIILDAANDTWLTSNSELMALLAPEEALKGFLAAAATHRG